MYVAPEMLPAICDTSIKYKAPCDMWSVGVIAAEVAGVDIIKILANLKTTSVAARGADVEVIKACNSKNADVGYLVRKLLVKAPKKRLTAAQALKALEFERKRREEELRKPATRTTPASPATRTITATTVVAAVATIGTLLSGIWSATRAPKPEREEEARRREERRRGDSFEYPTYYGEW